MPIPLYVLPSYTLRPSYAHMPIHAPSPYVHTRLTPYVLRPYAHTRLTPYVLRPYAHTRLTPIRLTPYTYFFPTIFLNFSIFSLGTARESWKWFIFQPSEP
jgi:hypothetical protein